MAKTEPTLAGAGTFVGSCGACIAGKQSGLVYTPNAPVVIGSKRLTTVTSSDATLPTPNISDDDGSVFTAVVNAQNPANELQWTSVSPNARPNGGNRIHLVWPNALQHATDPSVAIQDFNPSGS
jgi:hypothetical protein